MVTNRKTGLMYPQNDTTSDQLVSTLRSTFGPSTASPATLEQRLKALPESKLQLVIQVAGLVKMSHNFFPDRTSETYKSLVTKMYPKLDVMLRDLIAEILEDADPLPVPETDDSTKQSQRLTALQSAGSEYEPWNVHPEQPPTIDTGKAEAPEPETEQIPFFVEEDLPEGRDAFLKRIAPRVITVAQELGIDPRIVAAQAALETGWGKSVKGNNLFGIKSHGKKEGLMVQTHEVLDGKHQKITDSFRQYESFDDSIEDYGLFLRENKRYQPMLDADTLDEQIKALGKSGYATDPKYAEKITDIAKSKRLEALVS